MSGLTICANCVRELASRSRRGPEGSSCVLCERANVDLAEKNGYHFCERCLELAAEVLDDQEAGAPERISVERDSVTRTLVACRCSPADGSTTVSIPLLLVERRGMIEDRGDEVYVYEVRHEGRSIGSVVSPTTMSWPAVVATLRSVLAERFDCASVEVAPH